MIYKKLHKLLRIGLVATLTLLVVACGSNNDFSPESDEWKFYQLDIFDDVRLSQNGYEGYVELKSPTEDGSVYWKTTDSIDAIVTKITADGRPFVNDSVVCRYTGWYFNEKGRRIVFDTTEPSGGSINPIAPIRGRANSFIAGWTTMLTNMKKGDEVEVCIPHRLAYKEYGGGQIRGYTTLFFTIKLMDIISGRPPKKVELTEE